MIPKKEYLYNEYTNKYSSSGWQVSDDEVDREGDWDTTHCRDGTPPPEVETSDYSIVILGYKFLIMIKYTPTYTIMEGNLHRNTEWLWVTFDPELLRGWVLWACSCAVWRSRYVFGILVFCELEHAS